MRINLAQFRPLGRNLVAIFGSDVRLPSGATVRGVHYPRVQSRVDEYQATRYQEYPLMLPPGVHGIAQGDVVSIDGMRYYVAAVEPLDLGWTAVSLQPADSLEAVLAVHGRALEVDDALIKVVV